MRFIILFVLIGIIGFLKILSANYYVSQTKVIIFHIYLKTGYSFQLKNISQSDRKAKKAFYRWENKVDYTNTTLESIEFYPWNDGYDYKKICVNLVNQIKSFSGPLLIHNGFPGGLGHKTGFLMQSIIHSLSARQPIRFLMLDTFWLGTDSCLKPLMITWNEVYRISHNSGQPLVACSKSSCRKNQKGPVILFNYFSEYNNIQSTRDINALGLETKFTNINAFKKVLLRLVLNPSKDVQQLIQEQLASFPVSYTTVHIRSGGKLANHKELGCWMTKEDVPRVSKFVLRMVRTKKVVKDVFLSTDSDYIENYLKEKINLLKRMPLTRYHSTSKASVDAFKGSLFDLFIASSASHLIYTENSSYSNLIMSLGQFQNPISLPTSFRKLKSLK